MSDTRVQYKTTVCSVFKPWHTCKELVTVVVLTEGGGICAVIVALRVAVVHLCLADVLVKGCVNRSSNHTNVLPARLTVFDVYWP